MVKSRSKQREIDDSFTEYPSGDQKSARFWVFSRRLLLLTLFSGLLGAGMAWLLASSPLKPQNSSPNATQLPGSRDRITGLIPATLARPINVLVLGIDNSGHAHQEQFTPSEGIGGNSDTMLLVRIDPSHPHATVLSIPRDTRVRILGRRAKINAANPQGGIPLVGQTVSNLLGGIAIDRYVRVDTQGLIELVDALGGVEVTVPKAMHYVDNTQKLTIDFQPGKQVLNGQHLEEYVRFRHDQWGDIGRVQRQQAVLKSLSEQVLQPWTLFKLPRILAVIHQNVDTDLSLEELLAVGQTLARTDRSQYDFVMLPGRFSQPSEYRLSYWISNPTAIAALVERYFPPTPAEQTSQPSLNIQTLAIAVANGTHQSGLATKTVALLKAQGFRNAYITRQKIEMSDPQSDQTQIIAQGDNADAAKQVQAALGTGQVQTVATGAQAAEITVVVKSDLLPKLRNP